MKIILFIISLCFPLLSYAQDGYIFTREQHEQIKRNLQDYKILIKDNKILNHRFDSLKNAFKILKYVHSNKTIELEELKEKYTNLKKENSDVIFLKIENEKLRKNNESLQRELDYKNKSLYNYKGKYEREHRLNRGDRIIGNAVLGTFISCALWAIYTSIEKNYLQD